MPKGSKKLPIPKGKAGKHKIEKVMGEYKRGTLKTSAGSEVTDPRQAKAIAFSEARRASKTLGSQRSAARKKAGR